MNRSRVLGVLIAAGCGAVAAIPAQGATPAQVGPKCRTAWTGVTGSTAFRAYQPKCVAAAVAATDAATDAGNPTNAAANRIRSQAACGRRFPTPRNTAAKRLAFASCVSGVSAAQRSFAARPLKATLLGANEVPASGAATGTANIRLNQGKNRVCFTLRISGIGAAAVTAAHIHRGAAGAVGDPVVAFDNLDPLNRSSPATGCVQNVAAALITAIRQNPSGYYVNIHTAQYPSGAARGQLTR